MAHNFQLNEEAASVQSKRKKSSAGIIGLLIKTGIVKTEGQANALMLLIVTIGLAIIIYVNLKTFGG